MADIFIEHLVVQKTTPLSIALRVLYSMGYLVLCFAVMVFLGDLVIIVMAGGLYLLYLLFKHLNVEFEYILTNGEMDVDRITGRSKRKRMFTVDCRAIEVCAPMDSSQFSQLEQTQFTHRHDVSSGPGGQNRHFAVAPYKGGGRLLMIFEPDDRILAAMRTYNRRVQS